MDDVKFCCVNSKGECNNIKEKTKLNKKLAIFTLIFGGDAYIPGVLLLGSSIRKANSRKANMITLGCLVAPDVSKDARKLLENVYDDVREVEYIKISPSLISHRNEATRQAYSKTLTKLRCFELIEYDKIIFLDADMLVLKQDIFSLFDLKTPACVFMGGEIYNRYFRNKIAFEKFQDSYCKNLHGNLIPYDAKINEKTTQGLNIETSVMVLEPNIKLAKYRDKYLKYIETNKIKIKTDTELMSRMFKDKIYAIEPRFFGRWINPKLHPELVILDLYGFEGKPWDIKKLQTLLKGEYLDVKYWWDFYCNLYETKYKKYKNVVLDKLYYKIKEIY